MANGRRTTLTRTLLVIPATVAVIGAAAWGVAALWFDGPSARWLAGLLAAGFGALAVGSILRVRPYGRAMLLVVVGFALVCLWWLSIPPRNDRLWQPDVARLSTATIDGSHITLRNVRNFAYRSVSDYDERWETRNYDLDQLRGVDLFLSYWGPTQIAHTITSWAFADGSHLAVSIEVRKEIGEQYDPVRGFFRQFEIYYVVADERDVVRLRSNHRGESVYLYRLRMPPAQARTILLDYLREINALAERARWYNAASHNCTTAIRYHAKQVGLAQPLDWRLFANGNLPELAFERGMLVDDGPIEGLRARNNITERAKRADESPDFSNRIRVAMPGAARPPG